MKIEPVTLPAFGLAVNWAMCRAPMCVNFGVDLDLELPDGSSQVKGVRYTLKRDTRPSGEMTGTIVCGYCGQSAKLHSNHAIRPIARYFLSLSLPFADCSEPSCSNHGINVFEHWGQKRGGRQPYRPIRGRVGGRLRTREHMVRCSDPGCRRGVTLGTASGVGVLFPGLARWHNADSGRTDPSTDGPGRWRSAGNTGFDHRGSAPLAPRRGVSRR